MKKKLLFLALSLVSLTGLLTLIFYFSYNKDKEGIASSQAKTSFLSPKSSPNRSISSVKIEGKGDLGAHMRIFSTNKFPYNFENLRYETKEKREEIIRQVFYEMGLKLSPTSVIRSYDVQILFGPGAKHYKGDQAMVLNQETSDQNQEATRSISSAEEGIVYAEGENLMPPEEEGNPQIWGCFSLNPLNIFVPMRVVNPKCLRDKFREYSEIKQQEGWLSAVDQRVYSVQSALLGAMFGPLAAMIALPGLQWVAGKLIAPMGSLGKAVGKTGRGVVKAGRGAAQGASYVAGELSHKGGASRLVNQAATGLKETGKNVAKGVGQGVVRGAKGVSHGAVEVAKSPYYAARGTGRMAVGAAKGTANLATKTVQGTTQAAKGAVQVITSGPAFEKALAQMAGQSGKIIVGTGRAVGMFAGRVLLNVVVGSLVLPAYAVGCTLAISNEVTKHYDTSGQNRSYAKKHIWPMLEPMMNNGLTRPLKTGIVEKFYGIDIPPTKSYDAEISEHFLNWIYDYPVAFFCYQEEVAGFIVPKKLDPCHFEDEQWVGCM